MGTTKYDKKYWEREQAKVVSLGRNVFKLYVANGKIQVYPKVDNARNGVGRGSTIDLEQMNETELLQLLQVIQYAVTEYGNKNKVS